MYAKSCLTRPLSVCKGLIYAGVGQSCSNNLSRSPQKVHFFFKRILINTLKYIIQCRYWRFCLRKSSSQSRIPTWRALAPANPMLFCKAASISASSWGRPSLIIPLSQLCRWVTNEFVHHLGNEWPECSRCVCTYPQLW